MATMPWILRRSFGGRSPIHRPVRTPSDIDAWLDTVHRLAAGRAAERVRLARTGTALRARLRAGRR